MLYRITFENLSKENNNKNIYTSLWCPSVVAFHLLVLCYLQQMYASTLQFNCSCQSVLWETTRVIAIKDRRTAGKPFPASSDQVNSRNGTWIQSSPLQTPPFHGQEDHLSKYNYSCGSVVFIHYMTWECGFFAITHLICRENLQGKEITLHSSKMLKCWFRMLHTCPSCPKLGIRYENCITTVSLRRQVVQRVIPKVLPWFMLSRSFNKSDEVEIVS